MKKVIVFSIALLVPFITALKCEEDSGVDADNPSSLCDHIMKLCGDGFYENGKQGCIDDVSSMESCRKECAAEQNICDTVDQCLWWNLGADGVADGYCSGAGSGGEGEGEGEGEGGGGYSNLEDCAAGSCASANNACEANSQCTGIFNDCMAGCSDWDCVDLCASVGYSGGVDDFNTLWTCLSNNCSEYM